MLTSNDFIHEVKYSCFSVCMCYEEYLLGMRQDTFALHVSDISSIFQLYLIYKNAHDRDENLWGMRLKVLGDPEVTANMYCNFAYPYWEGCT